MSILEKVCISSYLDIFRLTAAAATAASQELSTSGKAPGPSRAGIKYPVQESLTSIKILILIIFSRFWADHSNRSCNQVKYGPYNPCNRSEGFPERDIWFLGVMDQGSCQIGRVVGTPPPPLLPET